MLHTVSDSAAAVTSIAAKAAEHLPDKKQKLELESMLSVLSSLGGADSEIHPTLWHVLSTMSMQAVVAYDAGQEPTADLVLKKVQSSIANK